MCREMTVGIPLVFTEHSSEYTQLSSKSAYYCKVFHQSSISGVARLIPDHSNGNEAMV